MMILQSCELMCNNCVTADENFDDDDDGDDIYIMMQCVFLCHEKSSLPTSELSAGGAKWAAR